MNPRPVLRGRVTGTNRGLRLCSWEAIVTPTSAALALVMPMFIFLFLVLSELFLSRSISVKAVSFPGPDSDLSTPPLLRHEDRQDLAQFSH